MGARSISSASSSNHDRLPFGRRRDLTTPARPPPFRRASRRAVDFVEPDLGTQTSCLTDRGAERGRDRDRYRFLASCSRHGGGRPVSHRPLEGAQANDRPCSRSRSRPKTSATTARRVHQSYNRSENLNSEKLSKPLFPQIPRRRGLTRQRRPREIPHQERRSRSENPRPPGRSPSKWRPPHKEA